MNWKKNGLKVLKDTRFEEKKLKRLEGFTISKKKKKLLKTSRFIKLPIVSMKVKDHHDNLYTTRRMHRL